MCTILIAFQVDPRAPLVIAANRDELYARPALAPHRLWEDDPVAVGGRDVTHGGTWMGLNERGIFVGLTNVRSQAAELKSRGAIVWRALHAKSVDELRAWLGAEVDPAAYRPFTLLFGTARELWVAYGHQSPLVIEPVAPGLHVLPSNGRLDDPELPKIGRSFEVLGQALEGALGQGEAELAERLRGALGDHWQPSVEALPKSLREWDLGAELAARLQSICVHTPTYGTRSATIAFVREQGSSYHYCDGPPCTTPLLPVPLE